MLQVAARQWSFGGGAFSNSSHILRPVPRHGAPWPRKGLRRSLTHRYIHKTRILRCEKSEPASKISYSQTLNLPQTDFPMRADAQKREPGLLRPEVYAWQKEHNPKNKPFVLHDGPPYANGPPHMGHVLNKVLKDFVVRYKIMQGYNVSYVPGWDCHGLPIEMKVLEKLPAQIRSKIDALELRKKAKEYALGQIEIQKKEFMRWGVLGEWNDPYMTMQPEYEAEQIAIFADMVSKGLIYRDYKPVYWSPSSRTALAEAELEYRNDHVSPSVYALFELQSLPNHHPALYSIFKSHLDTPKRVYASIWTTTPWTLPANLAISVGEQIDYSLVVDASTDVHFLIATALIESLASLTGKELKPVLSGIPGSSLVGALAKHPLFPHRQSVVLAGHHVTVESGTGLVHTAPGHGQDDFAICKANGIPPMCPVDDVGNFTEEAGEAFKGKYVLTEGNEAVLAALREVPHALFYQHSYTHKYPYDWRTKKPVIIRTTRQWFADLRMISGSSVMALQSVNVVPEAGLRRLESMLGTRQDWCISRQRSWGVPIPVFYDENANDEPLLTEDSIAHICALIRKHGSDCWWSMPAEELLAPEYRNQQGKKYRRGEDTMDVWFDSGSSWAGVLKQRGLSFPADVYLEGSDQHRGWFQSSLLTSVAAKDGQAPYKTLITHGFLLDEKQQKMSKSLGNVIEPSYVIDGGKDKSKSPAYGVDVMRFWVASTDYTNDVVISDPILAASFGALRKIRNTARFMIGNLFDFDPSCDTIPYQRLRSVDRYMLHQLTQFMNQISDAYESHSFYAVVHTLNHFSNADLSAFYLNLLKDRLYSPLYHEDERRAAQTTISYILDAFNKALAPIAVHTAEDIYKHIPWKSDTIQLLGQQQRVMGMVFDDADKVPNARQLDDSPYPKSVFCELWPKMDPQWKNDQLATEWEKILQVRSFVYRLIEQFRAAGTVSNSSEIDVNIYVAEKHPILTLSKAELEELLICAECEVQSLALAPQDASIPNTLTSEEPQYRVVIHKARKHKCTRCWRHVAPFPDSTCESCTTVLETIEAMRMLDDNIC